MLSSGMMMDARHRACTTAAALAAALAAAALTAMAEEALPPEPPAATQPTLAESLLSRYAALDTVACEIHKVTRSQGKTLRMLSRIHYQRPDRIHVENVSPSKRRIVADGQSLYYHEEGVARGFSRPIAELTPDWLASLRNVPGTATEHLEKLRGLAESALPPTPEGGTRRGYQADRVFVTLTVDTEGRLTDIVFHKTPAMRETTAAYRYEEHREVAPGCWIPLLHKATVYLPDGETIEETRRVGKLAVNQPVTPTLFKPDLFFQGVEFVNDFARTYSDK